MGLRTGLLGLTTAGLIVAGILSTKAAIKAANEYKTIENGRQQILATYFEDKNDERLDYYRNDENAELILDKNIRDEVVSLETAKQEQQEKGEGMGNLATGAFCIAPMLGVATYVSFQED